MPAEPAVWFVMVTFVSALGSTVIVVLRALTTGKIVVGRHYEDALRREDLWRSTAETALATNAQLSDHVGRLASSQEQSNAAMREALMTLNTLARAIAPPGRADRQT